MELIKYNTYYVAQCTFGEKDIAKKAGFRWNPDSRQWWTPSRKKAAKLVQYADADSLKAELAKIHKDYVANMELSRGNGVSSLDIPVPAGLNLYPFQRDGVAYALNRYGTVIADEMGLGKTVQALAVINCLDWIKRVLVICPASLKLNWKREAETWLMRPCTIGIADAKKDFPATDVVIINYDIIHKYHDELRAIEWDLMVCDEAHYMKAGRNRRSVFILGGKAKLSTQNVDLTPIPAKKLIFLTGTPVENGKPIEMWPLAHRLDPENWGSWMYYAKRFCGGYRGRYGWDVSGATNLDEYQSKLRETIMVRRMKSQVLTELPPKQRQVVELSAGGASGTVKRENDAWEKHKDNIETLQVDVELAKAQDKEQYEAAVARLKEGVSARLSEISRLRHATALAKVPAVLDFLEGRSGKVVIFAHHLDVIAKLQEHFGNKCVVLTGKQSKEQKQGAVDRFQNDPSIEVFLGGIKAAGVGLTLTASSHVIFVELDWVPGVVTQCEDRLHRIGQQDSVLVQHLILEGSLDAKMVRTLIDKQHIIDAALDDDASDMPVTPVEEAATRRLTRKKIEEEAPALTDIQVEAIHMGLRFLAALCDGAATLDGAGFNRLDVKIGHSLAMAAELTPKQAVLGQRLCIKYRQQFSSRVIEIIKGE